MKPLPPDKRERSDIRAWIIEQLALCPGGLSRNEMITTAFSGAQTPQSGWFFIDELSTMADEGIVMYDWVIDSKPWFLWRLTADAWLKWVRRQQDAS